MNRSSRRPANLAPWLFSASLSCGLATLPFPAQALTWNWSVTTQSQFNEFATGTFTTAETNPNPDPTHTYTITGITGTYHFNGSSYNITSLSTSSTATNTFRWDGTQASPLYLGQFGVEFYFSYPTPSSVATGLITGDVIPGSGDYSPSYDFSKSPFPQFSDADVNTSSLAPVPPTPAPLPLFGAAAAFQGSRRLRRRLKASKPIS